MTIFDESKAPSGYAFTVDLARGYVAIDGRGVHLLWWDGARDGGIPKVETELHRHAILHAEWLWDLEHARAHVRTLEKERVKRSAWVDEIVDLIPSLAMSVAVTAFDNNRVLHDVVRRLSRSGHDVYGGLRDSLPQDVAERCDVIVNVGEHHARLYKNRYGDLAYLEPGATPMYETKEARERLQRRYSEPTPGPWPEATIEHESPPCATFHVLKAKPDVPRHRVDFASMFSYAPGEADHLPVTAGRLPEGWNES